MKKKKLALTSRGTRNYRYKFRRITRYEDSLGRNRPCRYHMATLHQQQPQP